MEIICINDQFSDEQKKIIPNRPVRDKIYTVRDVVQSAMGTGLLLNEIHNPNTGWTMRNGMKFNFEPNFAVNRFATLSQEPLTVEMVKEEVKV